MSTWHQRRIDYCSGGKGAFNSVIVDDCDGKADKVIRQIFPNLHSVQEPDEDTVHSQMLAQLAAAD
jgi:hypothetical protein